MSKIPTIQERAIPQAAPYNPQPIIAPDMNAVPKAISDLSKSLANVGEATYRVADQRNKFDYSIAYSKFLQKSVNFLNDLDQDPDYANLPKKYKEGMAKIKQESLEGLGTDNRYAPNLSERMELWESQKDGNIIKTAQIKQTDAALAETDRLVDNNFESFARTKDEETRNGLLASSIQAFRNALPDNDSQKEQKVQIFTDKIEKKSAQIALTQEPTYAQIKMLEDENAKAGSNITKYLGPEERLKWLNDAKKTLKQEQEETRINSEKAVKQKKQEFSDVLADNLSKGTSWDDLPVNIKIKSTAQDKKDYLEMRKKMQLDDDIELDEKQKKYQIYEDMYVNDPATFANISKAELVSSVPPDKMQVVSGWQMKARMNLQPDSVVRQRNEIKSGTLRGIGIKENSNEGIQFKQRFDENVAAYFDENKRQPNAGEAQLIANNLVAQATFDKGFFGFKKQKRVFQVDKEDVAKDIVVPEDFTNRILSQAQAAGRGPLTDEQIRHAYLNKINAR